MDAKIFLNKLSKNKEKKLEWKYHLDELFSPDIIFYTDKQISLIKDLLLSHLPHEKRRDFWFIASGAKREMLNNPGYYFSILKNFPKGTQSPSEGTLKLDITRTFPFLDFYKKEENLKKLERILTAFVRRNATIGYSQGLNFIVGKLLLVIKDEEKTFWTFTQVVEQYLSGDFFLLFSGVRKDMKIIEKLINKELKFINTNIEICMSNLISKCFISLFAQTIPENALYIIWDAFFIYGEEILYKAFIWLAYLHYDKSLVNHDVDEINKIILEKMKNIKDINSLKYFLYLYEAVDNNKIKQWRKTMELDTIKETILNRKVIIKNKCDRNMPFCLYNNEENNIEKNKHFLVHKINYDMNIIKDYFFDNVNKKEKIEKKEVKKEQIMNGEGNNINVINIEKDIIINDELNISANSLMIERQKHLCPEEKVL